MNDPLSELAKQLNLDSSSPLSSRARVAEGKSGGFATPDSANARLVVGVVKVSLREVGSEVCGGKIGQSGKLCLARACSISSHETKAVSLVSAKAAGAEAILLIQAKATGAQAFAYPFLDVASLTTQELQTALVDRRFKDEWLSWFALRATGPPQKAGKSLSFEMDITETSDFPGTVTKARVDNAIGTAITPHQAKFEVSQDDSPDFVEVLRPVAHPLTDTAGGMEVLLINQDAIARAVQDVKDAQRYLLKTVADVPTNMASLADHINFIKVSIGTRPEDLDALSLWSAVGQAHEDATAAIAKAAQAMESINRLSSGPAKWSTPSTVDTAIQEAMEKMVKGDVGKAILASHQFVTTVGTGLEARVNSLEQGARISDPGNIFSVGKPVGASDDSALLMDRIVTLEAELREVRAEMKADCFVIGSVIFSSEVFTDQWVAQHNVTQSPFIFIDAVSLLQLAAKTSGEATSYADDAYKNQRLGLDSFETAVAHSFSIEVPQIYGTTASNSVRALGSVKSFEEWDPPSGTQGLKCHIMERVRDTVRQIDEAIRASGAASDAKSVARAMLHSSQLFVEKLGEFMSSRYRSFAESSGMTPTSNWGLISHLARTVWREIRQVRSGCSFGNAADAKKEASRASRYVWACVQAHRIMNDFSKGEIVRHPAIAPILMTHVVEDRASKESVKTCMDKADDALRMAREAKRVADKAIAAKPGKKVKTDTSE